MFPLLLKQRGHYRSCIFLLSPKGEEKRKQATVTFLRGSSLKGVAVGNCSTAVEVRLSRRSLFKDLAGTGTTITHGACAGFTNGPWEGWSLKTNPQESKDSLGVMAWISLVQALLDHPFEGGDGTGGGTRGCAGLHALMGARASG